MMVTTTEPVKDLGYYVQLFDLTLTDRVPADRHFYLNVSQDLAVSDVMVMFEHAMGSAVDQLLPATDFVTKHNNMDQLRTEYKDREQYLIRLDILDKTPNKMQEYNDVWDEYNKKYPDTMDPALKIVSNYQAKEIVSDGSYAATQVALDMFLMIEDKLQRSFTPADILLTTKSTFKEPYPIIIKITDTILLMLAPVTEDDE